MLTEIPKGDHPPWRVVRELHMICRMVELEDVPLIYFWQAED
jgi:hypothetical protein